MPGFLDGDRRSINAADVGTQHVEHFGDHPDAAAGVEDRNAREVETAELTQKVGNPPLLAVSVEFEIALLGARNVTYGGEVALQPPMSV